MSKPPIMLLLLAISCLLVHMVTPEPPNEPTPVDENCVFGLDDDYNPDSEHATNLRAVLEELQKQAFKTSYYNTSSGTGKNRVYGQYYCRGDIDSNLCGQCIEEASQSYCIQSADHAIIWYEECTLRYQNRSMVGINELDLEDLETFHSVHKYSLASVADTDKSGRVLNNTMDRLISKAAYGNGSLHFATGEEMVLESETVYCLVQCSPDLNGTQCESCLLFGYNEVIFFRFSDISMLRWTSMYYSSCQVRYSTYGAFYWQRNATPPPRSPPSPSSHLSLPPPALVAKGKNTSYYVVRAIIPASVVGLLIILGISFCLIQRKRTTETIEAEAAEAGTLTTGCLQFDLKTIEAATNSFSPSNKLGQGGFGIVYQGILNDGQDIAVKRLSKSSKQGTKEFKTEVAVVAKLQHKNLVKLVGCCVEGEERLLVYEFVPNLSLDRFLFHATRSAYMTWAIRHKIIQGIARGLHYLHEDSRLKIVHRDLKISNILLDDNLEPKIADFGLAKLVEVDQTSDNTSKVVGTYGYMSPEYALAGRYSTKSDVYSFGVILLEILSGQISTQFYDVSHGQGLLGFAWRVWNEGSIENLMDPNLQNNYSRTEAERCLQIGLLCIQDDESNRPTMHALLVMLNRTTVDLPPPFSPNHCNYVGKLPSVDNAQEGTSKQQENEASLSSTTFNAQKDLYAR